MSGAQRYAGSVRAPTRLAVDHEGYMVFSCGPSMNHLAQGAGLERDPVARLWNIASPWQARALWYYATNEADAALREVFPGCEPPAQRPELPVMFRDGNRMVLVCSAQTLKTANRAWQRDGAVLVTTSLQAALALADRAEPGLRGLLKRAGKALEKRLAGRGKGKRTSRLPFSDLNQIGLDQLFQIIDAMSGSGEGGREDNCDAEEAVDAIMRPRLKRTVDTRGRSVWRYNMVADARKYGFALHPKYGPVTLDPTVAEQARHDAEEATEVWFQRFHIQAANTRYAVPEGYEPPCPPGRAFAGCQTEGILFALARGNCLIGDEMGVGKTAQLLGLINSLHDLGWTGGRRMLIGVPAFLQSNWMREASDWLVGLEAGLFRNGRMPDTPVVIASYDVLHRPEFKAESWALLGADEAHYLKNLTARRTAAAIGRNGLDAERFVPMTGTPIYNRPQDLWSLVHRINPRAFPSEERFMDLYKVENLENVSKADRLAVLGETLRSGLMIRRLKRDVMGDLPAKRRHLRLVDISKRQQADLARRSLSAESAIERLTAGGVPTVERNQILRELTRLRRDLGMAKLPATLDMIDELAGGDRPFVVFSYYREMAEAIFQHMEAAGIPCSVAHGGHAPAERQRRVDMLQNGEIEALSATMSGAGTGLTMTRASVAIFPELDWSPTLVLQAEDRLHRRGQENLVDIFYPIIPDTLDARIARIITAKDDLAGTTLGDADPAEQDDQEGTSLGERLDMIAGEVNDLAA